MLKQEKNELIEAVLNVLRIMPNFSKRDEKNVKKILKKLDRKDLVYLANIFDELYYFLKEESSYS